MKKLLVSLLLLLAVLPLGAQSLDDDVWFEKSVGKMTMVSSFPVATWEYMHAGRFRNGIVYVYQLQDGAFDFYYVMIKCDDFLHYFSEQEFLSFLNAYEDMIKKLPSLEPNQCLYYSGTDKDLRMIAGGSKIEIEYDDELLKYNGDEELLAKLKEVVAKIEELRSKIKD